MFTRAAFKTVSYAPTRTVGTYNMVTANFTLTISACTYNLKIITAQQNSASTSTPGTTPNISTSTSTKTSLSPPAIILLVALAALLRAMPVRG